MDSRDDRALKRAAIVEKWWHHMINKAPKQSEKLWKEVRPGEVEEGQIEDLRKMRIQEILASQILSEREAHRERSPQEGGQEGEGVEAREKEADMDLEEKREYSSPMPGKIKNSVEETTPEEENETP
jgi:hypothetical protein